jgi:hypothetical protein
MLGVIPILVVAGTIEGFLSPTKLPPAVKYSFAAALFTLFAVYLTQAGRKEKPSSS